MIRRTAAVAVLAACLTAAAAEQLPEVWRVVSVHDGDTITCIDAGNTQRKVRLHGIDAPELGQPYSRASRDRLAALARGKAATVHRHGRDRYGREIASVEVEGDDLAHRLVIEGLAWHYRRYSRDAGLAAAEAEARAARRGLWAEPAPVAPWDYRAGERERRAAGRAAPLGR